MAEGGLAIRTVGIENASDRRAKLGAHTGTADATILSHDNFFTESSREWDHLAPPLHIARADLYERPQRTQLGALRTALDTNRYPKGLADFTLSIECMLNVAGGFLELVDMDSALVCQFIRRWLRELTDKCATVVRTLGPAVKHMFEVVLPALHVATLMSDRRSTVSLLTEVLEWSTHHRNGLQDVRGNYLFVLDRTKDLCRCIDLSIDCLNMDSTAEISATVLGLHMSYLESALAHVVKVTRLMEDCSDFWLRLHCAELDFNKISVAALDARNSILSERNGVRVADICWKLLVMLRNMCETEVLTVSGLEAGTGDFSSRQFDHTVAPHEGLGCAGKESIHTSFPTVWGMSC